MTTHDTTQFGLAFPVAAFGLSTGATSLAGVPRINQDNRHACESRLVADELPQLTKGPIAVSCSSRFPYRRPRANMRQVFQRNRSVRAFGFLDKPLADHVVGVFLKAPLASLELAQAALGRSGSDLLQHLTAGRIPLAAAFNLIARVGSAVRVSCQIDDAQVNPEYTLNRLLIRLWQVAHRHQVERATLVYQVAFALPVDQKRDLTIAGTERDVLPPVQRRDRHSALIREPGEDAVIESDRAIGLEGALYLAIQFVGMRNFRNAAEEQLRAQAGRFTQVVVDQALQRIMTTFRATRCS